MIQYIGLKEELLSKSDKDQPKQKVIGIVEVHRKTGLVLQHRKLNVKTANKKDVAVTEGQHLLDDNHSQATVKARYTAKQKKQMEQHQDKSEKKRTPRKPMLSEEAKNNTKEFSQKFASQQEFMDHISGLGITWKTTGHKGIDCMRAHEALSRAYDDHGYDPNSGKKFEPRTDVKVDEGIETKTAPETPASTASSNKEDTKSEGTKPAETAQKETPKKVVQSKNNMYVKHSEESKKKASDFYKITCGKDRDLYFKRLKEMGIQWKESSEPRTNYMYANRALSHAIEFEGLKLPGDSSQTSEKTAESAQSSGKSAESSQTGGKAEGEKSSEKAETFAQSEKADAAKASEKAEQPNDKNDESLLEIPEGASERERNIINHINNMTDVDAIEDCARLGMVPEDSRSQSFIRDELQVRLAAAVLNPKKYPWFNTKDSRGNVQFPPDIRDAIIKEWGMAKLKKLASRLPYLQGDNAKFDKTAEGFGRALADQLNITGCKKSCIMAGMEQLANFNMNYLVNPRAELSTKSASEFGSQKFADIFKSLNEGYSDYTTSKYKTQYLSNMGYTGHNADEYNSRYNVQKEGVYRFLKQIGKNNPALKDQVNMMCMTYDDIMQRAGHNPYVLDMVLRSPSLSEKMSQSIVVSNFGKKRYQSLPDIKRAINTADKLSNLVINELTTNGYSQDAIIEALSNTEINDGLTKFQIKNEDGGIDTIDFTEILDENDNDAVRTSRGEHKWGTGLLMFTQAKYRQSQNLPIDGTPYAAEMKNSMDFYNEMKSVADISEDDYKQIHELAAGFFGMNYVNGKELMDWSKADPQEDWAYGKRLKPADNIPEVNLVLANLLMGKVTHDVNSAIAQNVTNNAASNFNDGGTNYAGNYSYYSGGVMSKANDSIRYTQLGNSGENAATFTAKQLSAKINSQMAAVPNYSIEYIDKLKLHYKMNGRDPSMDSFKTSWGQGAESYNNSPIKDVLFNTAIHISQNTPDTAAKPTFRKLTAKKMDYVPYDFSKRQQPTFKKPEKPKPREVTPAELKQARQKLQEKANCSLGTMGKSETQDMWQQILQNDMDYKPGEKSLSGTTMGPRYTITDKEGNRSTQQGYDASNHTYNQVALLNSPIFKVNNSVIQERFQKRQEQMKAAGKKASCYEPIKVFNGTSAWAAANMLGREGAFRVDDKYHRSGNSALGTGPYGALKMGRALQFVGDQTYSYKSSNVSDGRADGIMCIMEGMLGEKNVTMNNMSNAKNPTSVTAKAMSPKEYRQNALGKTFMGGYGRDEEICFRDPDLCCVTHIFSVSSRVLGKDGNVGMNSYGYTNPNTGEVTHTANGINMDIQYK